MSARMLVAGDRPNADICTYRLRLHVEGGRASRSFLVNTAQHNLSVPTNILYCVFLDNTR